MITVAILLGLVPAAVIWDALHILGGQPGMALPQRNLVRATYGAFGLTYVVALWASVPLDPPFDIAGITFGAIAVLYLLLGVGGARGTQRDAMTLIWWIGGALGFGWLCFFVVVPLRTPSFAYRVLGSPASLVHPVMMATCLAACVASSVRAALMMWPAPGAKLPDPAKVPGMPIAGPASAGAAHAAMSRNGNRPRPKFKT